MGKTRLLVTLAGIPILFAGFVGVALALEAPPSTGAASGFLPQTFWDSTKPPAWNASQSQQMANIFTSCSNFQVPIQNLAAGLAGGAMGPSCPLAAGVTLETVCTGSDMPVNTSGLTCDTVGMNPAALDQAKQQIEMAMCTNQCRGNKLKAIQGEIGCLTQQANLLSQQVGSLTTSFTSNIQRMQTDVNTIKSTEADRAAQVADVNIKLNGDKDSGTPGILALKQQTQAMVNGMPAEIQAIRAANQKVQQQQKSLDEQVQQRTMALTMDCFSSRPVDTYRCEPNGPPVSAKDYLLCRYQQTQIVGSNGVIERNAALNAQSKSKDQGLAALLSQITGDAATDSKLPTTPEEQLKNSQQPLLVLTMADIQNRYGAALSKYRFGVRPDSPGMTVDAGQFVMTIMKVCNQRSIATTNIEQTRANTQAGMTLAAIRVEQQTVNASVTSLFSKYNQQYSADMNGLTGANIPLNTSACTSAAPMVQVACLEDIRKNMEGLLMGNSQNSAMSVQIKGNNPNSYVNFSCQGLNGCATSMQNVSRGLKAEQAKLQNFKRQYILQANQSAEGFTKQIASQLNFQSQMLTNRLKALNSSLASIGQGGGFNIPTIKGEAFEKDEDGLIKPPKNVLNLIGQYVNPPLPDVSGNSFSSSMSSVANAQQTTDRNYSGLMQSLIQIQNLGPSCQMNINRQMLQNVVQLGSAAQNCYQDQNGYCQERYGELQQALQGIMSMPGNQMYAGSLQSGVQSACEPILLGQSAERKEQASVYNLPRGCQAFFSTLISTSKMMQSSGQNSPYGGSNAGGAFGR